MMGDAVSVDSINAQTSQDSLWIADKEWVIVQKKTFTNWVNSQLSQGNRQPISDVTEDLVSGEALLSLLEVIGGVSLERYNHNPKLRIQKVENVNKALNFIHSRGVNLTNIGAEDIVDGNQKLILGLVWMIILKFSISRISEEGYEAKDALLLWCQRQTTQYGDDFKINDFTYSWKSGLGFCALIHKNHPDLIDYHSLDKTEAKKNTELAFDVAESKLKIPKLFEAADITDVEKPDERSVVTYLAQFFHTFTAEERRKKAAQKIAKFAHDMKACYHLKDDYEERFVKLKDSILGKIDEWNNKVATSHIMAENTIGELKAFRSGQKNQWATERKKLCMLLGTIQVKRSTYNLEPYNPPTGYTPKDMTKHWEEFLKQEKNYYDKFLDFIISYKESLRKRFSSLLESMSDSTEDISSKIGHIHEDYPELEAQLGAIKEYLVKLELMCGDISALEQCEAECDEAHVYDKGELAPGTSDDIKCTLDTLIDLAKEKMTIIKSQIDARKISDLDPGRLMELTETFHYMDKDKDGILNEEEFAMALKAEGVEVDDNSVGDLLQNVFKSKVVSYEAFIEFMKQEGGVLSHDQILNLFKTVSSGKKYLNEASLLECGISRSAVEDICKVITVDENGNLNYEVFLKNNPEMAIATTAS